MSLWGDARCRRRRSLALLGRTPSLLSTTPSLLSTTLRLLSTTLGLRVSRGGSRVRTHGYSPNSLSRSSFSGMNALNFSRISTSDSSCRSESNPTEASLS